ncbi:hypothetical protein KM043_010746 [Ampulex compressa]|nr:hypothetical protein KM043_010746 [Ampulex compressa]
MFKPSNHVKSTLLCGPSELSKTFMFQAAIHWAEIKERVVYITPAPLESLPAGRHDGWKTPLSAFEMMRFMYLRDYESLVKQLVRLHTFAVLPSVLLIDDLEHYVNDPSVKEERRMHIARICALVLDTMSSCSLVLKKDVHVCVWSSSVLTNDSLRTLYFRNVWNVTEEDEGTTIVLQKSSRGSSTADGPTFKYHRFQDGTRALREVLLEQESS